MIFTLCESLMLGESKYIYIAGEILNISLYIGLKVPAIGNLDNFCHFMKDGVKHSKYVYVLINF